MSAVLLTGGMVFDGLGGEARRADILVRHGRVAEIRPRPPSSPADNAATPARKPGAFDATGQSVASGEAVEIVDCSGLAVAPGFIDIHTHSDTSGLIHPLAENRLASGVTTELCGNCGGSAFPQDDYLQQRNLATLAEHNLEYHWADVTVFNQADIDDRATYQNPAVAPQGIKLVMVNGTIMYRNGQFIDRNRRPGQLLRHGGKQ